MNKGVGLIKEFIKKLQDALRFDLLSAGASADLGEDAIKHYTGTDFYVWINKILWGDFTGDSSYELSFLERAIYYAMSIAETAKPLEHGLVVERGTKQQFFSDLLEHSEPVHLDLRGLTSTTTCKKTVRSFSRGKLILRFNLPKGTPAHVIGDKESEVLLPPMTFDVMGIDRGNGEIEVELGNPKQMCVYTLLVEALENIANVVDVKSLIDVVNSRRRDCTQQTHEKSN